MTVDAANEETEGLTAVALHKLENAFGRGFLRMRVCASYDKAGYLLEAIHLGLVHRMVFSRPAYTIAEVGEVMCHALHPRICGFVIQERTMMGGIKTCIH